jgi:5-(carboxyamino)imidazole ribonucleotide mutase
VKFVSIIIGSKSDYDTMSECAKTLERFNVKYELVISSAHRSAERTRAYVKSAEVRGAAVFIAAAGMAAHLAGAVAAITTRPVIGVPMAGSALNGIDALLSTVQMPSGMPVATVAIGKTGAINSAYLSMQILAESNEELFIKLQEDRAKKAKQVEMDSKDIEILINEA